MPFHTIVTQNTVEPSHSFTLGIYYNFSYNLPETLKFKEPHCARLLWFGGAVKPILVFADFVERQYVNGSFESFLGCSAASSSVGWVQLASNQIPQVGYFKIGHADLTALTGKDINKKTKNYTVIVEIAPLSWINGT